jgi:protease II
LLSGAGDRKVTHFTDFIDSAIFVKENELASKIAVMSTSPSGSLTALASVFEEPFLFEGCAVHNPIADLVNHLLYDI